jgi:radical SAM protein with 4Fe4S-binding SPASM domain
MPAALEELDLHLTNRCNLRCRHCCFDSGRSAMAELPTRRIRALLAEATALGAREIHVTGGEPFVRGDVFEVVAEAVRQGARVRVQSNGTALDRRRLQILSALGIHELMISLDGPEEVHDSIRGRGTYAKAWNAVRTAQALGIPVRVNTVVMRRNLGTIPLLLSRTVDLGLKVHSFFHFTPFGAGAALADEVIGEDEWLPFVDELRRFCRARRVADTEVVVEQVFLAWPDLTPGQVLGCRIRHRRYCQILCDGSVSPCTFLLGSGLFLGNVREKSLETVWNDDRNWRRYEAPMSVCQDCGRFDRCQGGCWLYAYRLGGALQRDPRCRPGARVIPLCPYLKRNVRLTTVAQSTADALAGSAS